MIIKRNLDEIQNYLTDASNIKGSCEGVYIPENADELISVLIAAGEQKLPVTVSGNGTGLTGARVPQGGIVLSTEKLNKIIEINSAENYAVVEPGVLLSEFQQIVNEAGLLYPPDPTERNCYIGGTVATNASGEKSFKYGPTRNFVQALDIVLAGGELIKLERGKHKASGNTLRLTGDSGKEIVIELPGYKMPHTKNASGYYVEPDMDAVDLFIGSEGTLGVITKIKLKLISRPEKILSCLLFFNNLDNALGFILEAKNISRNSGVDKQKIDALALEFFDGNSLKFLASDYPIIPAEAQAAVWFEQEVTSSSEEEVLMQWMELIEKFNGDTESAWIAMNENENKKIQEFRHAVSAKVNEYISNNNLKKLGTDSAVADEYFTRFYKYCTSIVEEQGINYITYGHFGSSHIHLNMLPKSEEEYFKGKELYRQISVKAVEFNGTVSAEHGIGKLKTDYLLMMYGEDVIKQMSTLKKILDPGLILGIGNIIDKKYLT